MLVRLLTVILRRSICRIDAPLPYRGKLSPVTFPPPHQSPFAEPFVSGSTTEESTDRSATIALLVSSAVIAVFAALQLLLALAFIDHCPPETCSTADATRSMFFGQGLILASLVVGIALCVWRLVKKQTAWWIALATLGAVLASTIIGFVSIGNSAGMFG